mgnify:CR=1 FL=1
MIKKICPSCKSFTLANLKKNWNICKKCTVVFKKQNTLNIDYLKFALTQRSIKNYFKKYVGN